MSRRPSDRVKAYVARAASRAARRFESRRGMLGRAVRALDRELNLEYLARIAAHEDALIDRLVAGHPPSGRLKVSIVVPTYDVALPYVRELLTSVERQTYANWELCFADDCDPLDDVALHLAALARERPDRVKYRRHRENRGIAAATRTGLELVEGELVAFVDADDLLHRRALEAVVSRFEADARVDFVYTDHDTTTDLGFRRVPIRKPAFSPELLQCINYVNHLVVVRRSCLERCEGAFADGTSGSQDWDLCLRLVDHARRVSHVPAVLYHWRARPGSVAADSDAKPWVLDACLATRRRHLSGVDARLDIARERTQHRHHYEPDLGADAEPPAILVLVLSRAGGEAEREGPRLPAYEGESRRVVLAYGAGTTNAGLVAMLSEACADATEELVWILEDDRPVPEGALGRLVAFAIQPAVGAVWPFRRELVRLCYTLDGSADRLAQPARATNAFTRFSGNVLTGPLHGMLARTSRLCAALKAVVDGAGREGADLETTPPNPHTDTVGASIGLAMLEAGARNVGCRGMMCDIDLDEVEAPLVGRPDVDPWL